MAIAIDQALLLKLCQAYGVLTEYRDVFGQRQPVPVATLHSLLSDLGVPLDDAEAARNTLAERENVPWLRPLPPVLLHRASAGPCAVALSVPANEAKAVWRWTLHPEHGAAKEGAFQPASLPVAAKGKVGRTAYLGCTLTLPATPEPGYHRLVLQAENGGAASEMLLVVAPDTCYVPDALAEGNRVWGLAVQLYGVRSARNWGMGDFTDLLRLMETASRSGASLVGVNPLHALFPHNPLHASPYSPSSRSLVNVLYLDVEAAPDFGECEAARQQVHSADFQARLRALRGEPLVDYAGVAAAKREILEPLYRHFRDAHLAQDSERAQAFRRFQAEGGEKLARQGLYEALQEKLFAEDSGHWGWPVWPEAYRHPATPEVQAFAAAQTERIEFFHYLQWLADEQLGAVGRRSWELRLGVGLYQDIAVGADIGGCELWSHQELYAIGAHVGAPPDDFNRKGQDWGPPPLHPVRLREAAYTPFIAMLRENMRHAGAVRLDHVMGLMRLYWVPADQSPAHGGYVLYPLDDLLGILALESQRNRCLVVGEDLGTVPDEIRDALGPMRVYSYRLLLLERDKDGGYLPPQAYPAQSLAAITTHDLPTLCGFWKGTDLDARTALDLFPDESVRQAQVAGRAQDRAFLLMALEREGLLPPGTGVHPVSVPEMTDELIRAVHLMLSRAPSQLLMVQMEDVLGVGEQANLPGTVDQHPNWRRKLPLDLENWPEDWRAAALFEALGRERGPALLPAPEKAALRIPRATYRLQFNRHFTFADAEALVPYLARLGVSHCYASPFLRARAGSSHGYDIIDHNAFNPEIGTPQDFERFSDALARHGMGLMLDVVPNHMGILGSDNAWWLDVLEHGPASPHAAYFDIDWRPINPDLRGKVLLPVLGDHYGRILENGELALDFAPERGEFHLQYYEHRFPLDPREYPRLLGHRREMLAARLGAETPLAQEYESLTAAFGRLPERCADNPEQVAERVRDSAVYKRQLAELCAKSPDIAVFLAENLAEFNGQPGNPESFDALHELIQAQAYRLSYWRVAADDINYRRFFDINDLAGLRMENPEVFEAAHRLVFRLLAEGRADALRIDHPDGLYDPQLYFRRLQSWRDWRAAQRDEGAPSVYLVIEKILADYERLPENWAVHGTTGYDFANTVNGLLVDGSAEKKFDRLYTAFTTESHDFADEVYQGKRLITEASMASELNVLASHLSRIAQADRRTRDYTLSSLRRALEEVVACFPVYRTYIADGRPSEEDRRYIDWAISLARRNSPAEDISVFDFLRQVLTLDGQEDKPEPYRAAVAVFVGKFQQYTGPVMAKGFEDTALYRYHRLASLNEVGGDPRRFGVSVAAFHKACRDQAKRWPHALLATSTHDSKRSEDVRARIDVLSEIPSLWRLAVRRWNRLNRSKKTLLDGILAPSRNDEYLLYQILVGSWPVETYSDEVAAAYAERIVRYMLKAVREAKTDSSWINPNAAYEKALEGFVRAILQPGPRNRFLDDLAVFQQATAHFGALNSLSQALLKLTIPGVPDIYQGNEIPRLCLVDPDNRQPVDFAALDRSLGELERLFGNGAKEAEAVPALLASPADGRAKLYLTWRALQLRREQPQLFELGAYQTLDTQGAQAAHLCAFARVHRGHIALVVAPRLCHRLLGGEAGQPLGKEAWGDTAVVLPPEWAGLRFRNRLGGESMKAVAGEGAALLSAAKILARFPAGLLLAEIKER